MLFCVFCASLACVLCSIRIVILKDFDMLYCQLFFL